MKNQRMTLLGESKVRIARICQVIKYELNSKSNSPAHIKSKATFIKEMVDLLNMELFISRRTMTIEDYTEYRKFLSDRHFNQYPMIEIALANEIDKYFYLNDTNLIKYIFNTYQHQLENNSNLK